MKFSNRFKGFYLLWIVLNVLLLIISEEYSWDTEAWYPVDSYFVSYQGKRVYDFDIDPMSTYDLSEFFVYTILLFVLIYSYKLLIDENN